MQKEVSYGLKIKTIFTKEQIEKNTRVINIDKSDHVDIFDSNLENLGKDFISHIIINLNTAGASVNFKGRYKAENSLCDVFCEIVHKADNTKSNIDIKGIAKDGGKIISRSNILVEKNVKGVDGYEKAKFIFVESEKSKGGLVHRRFSEDGEIDAIPNLDIYSHEVKVGHAMSISKIKEADIWYAGLHGSSRDEAKKLFEENFLN